MMIFRPPSASPNKRCPHLGLRDDPETALGFSSNWNCCHNVKPIATPNLAHQQSVCLTNNHIFCPASIHAEQKSSLPKDLRMPKPRGGRKTVGPWVAVGIILFFVIAGGLIFSGYWSPAWGEKLPALEWISRVLPKEIATNTNIPIIETDTPEVPNTPIAPTEYIVSTTQTEPALPIHCANSLETPIGADEKLLLHRVAFGENMVLLAERYQTTVQAIDAVNYFMPSPVWAEMVIVIPVAIKNADDLQAFRPVLLEEDDISLEELALNLSIPLSELMEFNQLDSSCRSFNGWIIIPTEKVSN